MAQQVEENHLLTCFSFSQVHVNTTEQIDLQKTYKLWWESYKLSSAPPSTNVNLSKLQWYDHIVVSWLKSAPLGSEFSGVEQCCT